MWSWLETPVPASQVKRVNSLGYPHGQPLDTQSNRDKNADNRVNDLIHRPELQIFGRAMVGGGKLSGAAHIVDYPWGELGDATVVDIGGGIGGFPLQLSDLYPKLSFVVQDSAANVAQGEPFWAQGNPTALASGKVRLMEHDFFQENPVKDADVYWMRYILHDWSDDYCIQILSQIRKAMGPKSRILIADQVMNITLGCEELQAAPEPLLANYGAYVRNSHRQDLTMMAVFNGIERTPKQLKMLLETAGLKILKIWECRSLVGIVEAVKM